MSRLRQALDSEAAFRAGVISVGAFPAVLVLALIIVR
jgi:hypothetical protein